MFQAPDYTHTVSMRLSEVLADIAVDQKTVLKTRRAMLLNESIQNRVSQLQNVNNLVYLLGSRSEGTTTTGLHSDTDNLNCLAGAIVIEDWSEWQPGVANLLMLQDDTVAPGYCLLQWLRDDAALPGTDIPNKYKIKDLSGRILVKNTLTSETMAKAEGAAVGAEVSGNGPALGVRHGAAYTPPKQPGVSDNDFVGALRCKTWPLQARRWLDQQSVGQWPSVNMKRYCSNTACFVVGVDSKRGENEETEWRISTSLAERYLMLNLNITQIRCCVLMKMILKTYIKPLYAGTISSFMCKTVLLQLISKTHFNFWRENNLLVCLSHCLFALYNSVLNENCPHFMIPGNNLMARHIAFESKPHILEILQYIINSEGKALLEIKCDDLGDWLGLKMTYSCLYSVPVCQFQTCNIMPGRLLKSNADMIHLNIQNCLQDISNSSYEVAIQILRKYISKLVTISNQSRNQIKLKPVKNVFSWFFLIFLTNQSRAFDRTACRLLAPWFCTILGSTLASLSIQQYNDLSTKALRWIIIGLNTDVSSSKLKLASMFYCIGDYHKTEIVLRDIERRYDQNIVEPFCKCYEFICIGWRRGFIEIADNHNEEALQYATASCVRFLPCEINCIPKELQYEMYRSTEEDLAFRDKFDYWMDWAVIDSLPYLYFLQYKTYNYLGRQDDKQRALSNIIRAIEQEPNLGHKETALNILGQCMEQEDQPMDALHCYSSSINLRGRNNAAKFHLSRLQSDLVSTLINEQA